MAENLNVNPSVQLKEAIQKTGATFQTSNAKLYVPVVTLSINDNIKFLENIKQGLKKIFFGGQIYIWNNNTTKK